MRVKVTCTRSHFCASLETAYLIDKGLKILAKPFNIGSIYLHSTAILRCSHSQLPDLEWNVDLGSEPITGGSALPLTLIDSAT